MAAFVGMLCYTPAVGLARLASRSSSCACGNLTSRYRFVAHERQGQGAVSSRLGRSVFCRFVVRRDAADDRSSASDKSNDPPTSSSKASTSGDTPKSEPAWVEASPMSAEEKKQAKSSFAQNYSEELKEIEEVSPKVLVRLLSVIWIGFSVYAIINPLKLPAAVRLIKAADVAPEVAPLVAGLMRIYLGALSLTSALVFGGFEPNHQQATEASSAFMAMALTQIAYFRRLSYPAIALAVAQLLIGIYFSGVAGKMQNDKSPPDFLREFLQAMENPESKRLRPSAGAEAKPSPAPNASPSENASRTISFLFVALTIVMVLMPQRFLRWTLSPAMLQLATSSEATHKGLQDLVRNILSVMVIAAGRVFAPAGPPSSALAGRAARGLYVSGIVLLVFARGIAGQPQILAQTPGTFMAAFFLWSAMNFSGLSGKLKKQEVTGPDPSDAVIDVDAK